MTCTPARTGTPQSVIEHVQSIRKDYLHHYPITTESIQIFNGESFEIIEVTVEDHFIQPMGQYQYPQTEQLSASCPHTTFITSLFTDWGSQSTRAIRNSELVYSCHHLDDWCNCVCQIHSDLI